ncbi:DUF4232 domain-containing protein [Streptomyces sp. NPDC002537]
MRSARLVTSVALAGAAVLAAGAGQAQAAPHAERGPVTAACATATTKVTVQTVNRPINHALLTLTNTGSKACNAYAAPYLGFDAEQQVGARILKDSRPEAVVTLAPGESAYAGIGLSRGDGTADHGRTVGTLRVSLADRNGSATGKPATVALPKGTYVDDSAFVTFWQADPAAALVW